MTQPAKRPRLTREQLAAFFTPRNVALVGASDKSRWSQMVAGSFEEYGHVGRRFAVNRSGKDAHGLPGYTSVTDIPEPVDAAYIYVPASAVEAALRDAAAAGVRNTVVLSSGFAEAGEEGKALQESLARAASECGVAMLGPNSLGFANFTGKSFCTSMPTRLPIREGQLAIVSQSGAVAVELAKWAHAQCIGMSFICATGNEAGIGIADVLDYLVDDPATSAIALYVEGMSDTVRFMEAAARARQARKPLVLLKIGRSETSNAVVQAHTGALAGDDKIFDAMCARHAITRTTSIEELISTADCLGRIGPINPPRIGAASISGGACSMYADLAEVHGLSTPPYADETRSELARVLPDFASSLNPLDVTGVLVAEPHRWAEVLPVLLRDPGMGLIVTIYGLPKVASERQALDSTFEAIAQGYAAMYQPPAIMSFSLQDCVDLQFELREKLGLEIVMPSIELGVRALAHLERWSKCLLEEDERANAGPADYTGERPSSEYEALEYLKGNGVPVIPTVLAASAEQAAEVARTTDGPVVLKIASPDIAHKTEAGGIRLDLDGEEAVLEAYDDILDSARKFSPDARIDGVLVAPMRPPALELIVGTVRDAQWGPALLVGLGGIFTEVMDDSQICLLPVSRDDVRTMLERLRGAKLLEGFRGAPAANIDRLIDAIVAIGDAALGLGPELAALEVNPLRVHGSQIECLDALAIFREPARQ